MAQSLAWTLPAVWPHRAGVRRDGTGTAESPVASDSSRAAETDAPELSDAALVDACLAGRAGAFDVVVERHQRTVYRLCYRFVGNHEDACDLSQDVFLRAYRGLRSFRGQSSLATWLYRIGVDVWLNRVTARTPPVESIEGQQYVDMTSEIASELLMTSQP